MITQPSAVWYATPLDVQKDENASRPVWPVEPEPASLSVAALLRNYFAAPQYAYFEEVANATGGRHTRSADGIAVGLWPSRGMEVTGIEVKSHRSDWLRELKDPKKAEAIFNHCDRWFLATDDESIARPDEIPPTWGWVTVKNNRLAWLVPAPKLTPQPLSIGFFAALARKANAAVDSMRANYVPLSEVQAQVAAKVTTEVEIEKARLLRATFPEARELETLKKDVADFEYATGIEIRNWGVRREIAQALHAYRSGQVNDLAIERLSATKEFGRQLAQIAERIQTDADALSPKIEAAS